MSGQIEKLGIGFVVGLIALIIWFPIWATIKALSPSLTPEQIAAANDQCRRLGLVANVTTDMRGEPIKTICVPPCTSPR